jgi:fermentation-respiration switch protein FrsA (DUF1100 family)
MPSSPSFVAILYLALPIVAAGWAAVRTWRTRSGGPAAALVAVVALAGLIALGTSLFHAWLAGAAVRPGQVAVTTYLAVGVLSMFRVVGWVLKAGVDRVFRVRTLDGRLAIPAGTGQAEATFRRVDGNGQDAAPAAAAIVAGGGAWMARAALATVVRSGLLFALTLVYVIAVGMVYRPKLADAQDPAPRPDSPYQPVTFRSTDGLRLAGWWMPAGPPPAAGPATRPTTSLATMVPAATAPSKTAPADQEVGVPATAPADEWGRRTVILCHGLGLGKSTVLPIARGLVPHGINVLAFDFRAHGESDGVLASFGDAERADVLAAVRWVRATHPEAAGRVFGVGVDAGAAALLAAAADPSPDGQAIDAVAVFGVFEDLPSWADAKTRGVVPKPIDWAARHLSAPIAGLHTGANLTTFSPAALAERVAPRPVLVVHGRADDLVPFDQGAAVFESASQPKLRFWVGEQDALKQWVVRSNPKFGPTGRSAFQPAEGKPADHARTAQDDEAIRAVRLFFETALPLL